MIHEQARILIADDEGTFRLSTAPLLRQTGYLCDCAQDSEEAARRLEQSYDQLIADIRMPGNTELEFLRSVHDRLPELPVIVLSGYPSLATAVAALRLSISDYLLKPVELPELRQAVARALEKGRLLRAVRDASVGTSQLTAALGQLEQAVTVRGGAERPPIGCLDHETICGAGGLPHRTIIAGRRSGSGRSRRDRESISGRVSSHALRAFGGLWGGAGGDGGGACPHQDRIQVEGIGRSAEACGNGLESNPTLHLANVGF